MTTIVRFTRHEPELSQVAELTRIFGESEISTVNETLPTDAKAAVARFDELVANASIAEVVLPTNLLEAVLKFSQFSKRGGMLIRASMNRTTDASGNALFTFDHYEKVVKVEIVTERL